MCSTQATSAIAEAFAGALKLRAGPLVHECQNSNFLQVRHGAATLGSATNRKLRASSMINHVSIGVRDIAKSKRCYDATLKPLGYKRLSNAPSSLGYGRD